jgi:hypothetical protein
MAKAKVTKQVETSAPAPAPATTEKTPKGQNDRFVRLFEKNGVATVGKKEDGTPAKLAPQLQVIVNTLEAAGKEGMTREELVKALDGVITTRQPVGRIVSYYQKDMKGYGLVQIN